MADLAALGHSPIKPHVLHKKLANYHDQFTAKFLVSGFSHGFTLFYSGPRKSLFSKKLKSASSHQTELLAIVHKEHSLGRVAGPCHAPPLPNFRTNPIGVVPKKDGGWRLICNLSATHGYSINCFIHPELCSVTYSSFDEAIKMISALGHGSVLC